MPPKRPTAHVIYVTNDDFHLICQGYKTATSWLRNRRKQWPVGSKILIEDQDGLRLHATITYNYVCQLKDVTDEVARTIGYCGAEAHREAFLSENPDYDDQVGLSVVEFKVK